MGYTHYFPMNKPPTADQWKSLIGAFSEFYALNQPPAAPLIQHDCDTPTGVELRRPSAIQFNGEGSEGYETFILSSQPPEDSAFCKTARRPYDLFVVAALVLAEHHCPECYDISSDGNAQDWQEGLQLVKDSLGYGELPKGINP